MNKKIQNVNRIVEIDTDGVLANMDGSYTPYLKKLIPDYSEEKYIDGWGMPKVQEACPQAFEIVQGLWNSYEHMRNLERFPDVEYGFQTLANLGLNAIVHTHVYSDDAEKARQEWLEELMMDADANFEIDICKGKTKKVLEQIPYVTIEDNITNLNRSQATIKILIRRCHNRNFTEKDIIGGEVKAVCSSFYEATQLLANLESKNEMAAC